jgi:PadR family transcriptional regulator, regulatory protein PadR
MDRSLFPGALEMMLLQALRRQPMHGYALVQHIRGASGDLLQIEEGSLYPALQRMLKAKWVSAEWGLSARNRRVRIYRITAAGCEQLDREVSAFKRMLDGIWRAMRTAES